MDEKGQGTKTIDGITFTSRALLRNLDEICHGFPFVTTCGKEVDEIEIHQIEFLKNHWLDTIKVTLLDFGIQLLSE